MSTHTALLVIDLQRGAFDGLRCPPVHGAGALIDRAVALVDAAHDGGHPVVLIRHCEGAGQPFEDGSPHGELHERLAPRPGDTVVCKRASSAFEDTALGATLDYLGAKHLVLCGLQSEFCVSNTAKAALAEGYAVTLAQDAHATWPSDDQAAAAISQQVDADLQALGVKVVATADLVRTLRPG